MYLTARSPFASRFLAWVHERFPVANALLFFVLYASALLLGRAAAGGPPGAVPVGALDVAGFLAVWGFFLLLRVFDEHKDYALDLVNHPQRVLQSGLVTLAHLEITGALAAAFGLAVSLAYDGGVGHVTEAWAVMMGWSLLMAKEFFVGEWLSKRLVLYAVSHMLVMPLALAWMAQMGAGGEPLPRDVAPLAAMAFLAGAAFEIARKIKAPGDERAGVDSYTKALGLRAALATLAAVVVLCCAAAIAVLRALYAGAVPWGAWTATAVAAGLPLFAVGGFVASPSSRRAKAIEAAVGVAMLVVYGTLIACVAAHRGLAWR
jgi:4-hydroxybenzoate polyprenyltransferase